MSLERIDRLLSHQGFGSRKEIRRLLKTAEVLVNKNRVFDPGFSVDSDKDEISIDGEILSVSKNIYLMMNKPKDTVSANKDGLHRTVFDLLDSQYHTPYLEENLHLAGRLDVDTEGLLLFTTDGLLIHRITSPKTHAPKSYFVRLAHPETPSSKEKITALFEKGIEIPPEGKEAGALLKPAQIQWKSDEECVLIISEGKYHQVKRMFLAVGNEVSYLKRLSIGSLVLDEKLPCGAYRCLTEEEIASITSD